MDMRTVNSSEMPEIVFQHADYGARLNLVVHDILLDFSIVMYVVFVILHIC